LNLFVAVMAWATTVLAFYMSIYQRTWWLWLLSLHGQETTELAWTWRVARLIGLRRPEGQATDSPDPQ
jgi:hypothetical protein